MINKLLAHIAPHHCFSCGIVGSPLCDNCKYDIISEPLATCLQCEQVVLGGSCVSCALPYSRGWAVSAHADVAARMIHAYKFTSQRALAHSIARCIADVLPELPHNLVIVPVPTIPAHIRERGFDHTLELAKQLSVQLQRPVLRALRRNTMTVQRGATRQARIAQAADAFLCRKSLDPALYYLVIDDVVTTGATISAAAQVLQDAGAGTVWATVFTRKVSTEEVNSAILPQVPTER